LDGRKSTIAQFSIAIPFQLGKLNALEFLLDDVRPFAGPGFDLSLVKFHSFGRT